ncbi:MAG: hypothetical protein IMF01_05540 [Proteobacteria bacterium]|nr:hypothetical protein [Pseudomonadota bacterium]
MFIAVPRTGSNSISDELCEMYDGEPILEYHSNYFEFERQCSKEEKDYFVFCSVRNPMDDAASLYMKFMTDHDKAYSEEKWRLDKGGYMSKRRVALYKYLKNVDNSFASFLRKFYDFKNFPYTSNSDINAGFCSATIRFENLEKDFDAILNKVGIEKKRPLPRKNPTRAKKDFLNYYEDNQTQKMAVRIFGPAMEAWGYSFPDDWDADKCGTIDRARYRLMKKLRYLYARHFMAGALQRVYWLRNQLQ